MTQRVRFSSMAIASVALAAFLLAVSPAPAADDSKVKGATQQVETGAKKIGEGQVGKGVEETAKGVGKTVTEGAKEAGNRLSKAGEEAKPVGDRLHESAKGFGEALWDSMKYAGRSVVNFFTGK